MSLTQSSHAFSAAAAAAMQQLQEQVRSAQEEAVDLREKNETLQRNFRRYADEQDESKLHQRRQHDEVVQDTRRLQALVVELREALVESERRRESLETESLHLQGEAKQMKRMMEEWRETLAEMNSRSEQLERKLHGSEQQAAELTKRLSDEKARSARTARLLEEKAALADELQSLCRQEREESQGAHSQAAAARQATAAAEAEVTAARDNCRLAEERARAAEAQATDLQEKLGRLTRELEHSQEACQHAEAQVEVFQARLAERLKVHEERSARQAADSVAAAQAERDREAEAAAMAKSGEARAKEQLQSCQQELDSMRIASERTVGDLREARQEAESAWEEARLAKGSLAEERRRHEKAEAALDKAEATMAQLLELNKDMVQNFVTAFQARVASGEGGPSLRALPAPESTWALPAAQVPGLMANGSSAPDASVPRVSPARAAPPSTGYFRLPVPSPEEIAEMRSSMGGGVAGAGPYPSLYPHGDATARASQMPEGWQQVQSILIELEEELRQLDGQYNDLLLQEQRHRGPKNVPGCRASPPPDLAQRTKKVKQAMQRKGKQIAVLRDQAASLRVK